MEGQAQSEVPPAQPLADAIMTEAAAEGDQVPSKDEPAQKIEELQNRRRSTRLSQVGHAPPAPGKMTIRKRNIANISGGREEKVEKAGDEAENGAAKKVSLSLRRSTLRSRLKLRLVAPLTSQRLQRQLLVCLSTRLCHPLHSRLRKMWK